MDNRNIKRSFLFRRALTKFNKTNSLNLFSSHIYLLFALDENGSMKLIPLFNYMKYHGRMNSYEQIQKAMIFLRSLEYVTISPFPAVYSLTTRGINALSEFERLIRVLRSDK